METNRIKCVVCGRLFDRDEGIQKGDSFICLNCLDKIDKEDDI